MESGKQKVGKHSPKSVLIVYKGIKEESWSGSSSPTSGFDKEVEVECRFYFSSGLSSPTSRLDKRIDSAKWKAESGK